MEELNARFPQRMKSVASSLRLLQLRFSRDWQRCSGWNGNGNENAQGFRACIAEKGMQIARIEAKAEE
ncbi:hypothetical protein SESBI_28574 [Sesbania bispinosa]|nr:hypothetical protein SESBI_28574 [Sesbania bispinosa]